MVALSAGGSCGRNCSQPATAAPRPALPERVYRTTIAGLSERPASWMLWARRDQYIHNRMFRSDPIATLTFDELPALPQSCTPGELFEGEIIGRILILGAEHPLTFTVEARIDPDALGRRRAGHRPPHGMLSVDPAAARPRIHRSARSTHPTSSPGAGSPRDGG